MGTIIILKTEFEVLEADGKAVEKVVQETMWYRTKMELNSSE